MSEFTVGGASDTKRFAGIGTHISSDMVVSVADHWNHYQTLPVAGNNP